MHWVLEVWSATAVLPEQAHQSMLRDHGPQRRRLDSRQVVGATLLQQDGHEQVLVCVVMSRSTRTRSVTVWRGRTGFHHQVCVCATATRTEKDKPSHVTVAVAVTVAVRWMCVLRCVTVEKRRARIAFNRTLPRSEIPEDEHVVEV